MSDPYSQNAKSGNLFLAREAYVEPPSGMAAKFDQMEQKIIDLEMCLAGNSQSKRWQQVKMELDNEKRALEALRAKQINNAPLATNRRLENVIDQRGE